jgi:hypothetical protein
LEATRAVLLCRSFAQLVSEVNKFAVRLQQAASRESGLSGRGRDTSVKTGQQMGSFLPVIEKSIKPVNEGGAANVEQ